MNPSFFFNCSFCIEPSYTTTAANAVCSMPGADGSITFINLGELNFGPTPVYTLGTATAGGSWAGAADGFACSKCRGRVFKTSPPWCKQCGLPFDGTTEDSITCKNCHEADWQFARALNDIRPRLVREVIHRYK